MNRELGRPMARDVGQLRTDIDRTRADLVQALVDARRAVQAELTFRHHVRRHPWGAVAVAAGLGLWVALRR